ncbi:MAG: hypothetical protein ABSH48_25205, partial [Verrucomicrobiota bacterium]
WKWREQVVRRDVYYDLYSSYYYLMLNTDSHMRLNENRRFPLSVKPQNKCCQVALSADCGMGGKTRRGGMAEKGKTGKAETPKFDQAQKLHI